MKRLSILLLLLPLHLAAQQLIDLGSNGGASQSIFRALERVEEGQGLITIDQPEYIRIMVGRRPSGMISGHDGVHEAAAKKISGYRIQLYSSNRKGGKQEALSREQALLQRYPQLATYVNYYAPFWKLRVGNFISRQEAEEALAELKENFPTYARQMYIVRDAIYLY